MGKSKISAIYATYRSIRERFFLHGVRRDGYSLKTLLLYIRTLNFADVSRPIDDHMQTIREKYGCV